MTPQLVIPAAGNPYYNTKRTGGYSPCILGNPQRRDKGLNVLPNCVGYAVGRFNEIGGYGSCKWLGSTNACNFISLAQRQGLTISRDPVPGGIMVWKGGKTGEGHVAVVEMPVKDGKVVTSESEYYGKPFVIYTRSGTDWRDGCYWMGSSYTYLGCIVNPAVEDDMTKDETLKLIEKTIRDMVPGIVEETIERLQAAAAEKPADDWAKPAIERVKASGLMVGDPDGNFRPQSPIKREEAAVILAGMMPDR